MSKVWNPTDKMDIGNLMPLVERLEDNIDDLEEVLEPLLNGSLNQISTNLPLLDKAKLHVLIAYSLESLLFCTSPTLCLGAVRLIYMRSLSPSQWRQSKGASRFPRTHPSQAIL